MAVLGSGLVLLVILLISTLVLLYKYATRNLDYWRVRRFHHLKSVPLIGNFGDIILGKANIAEKYREFCRMMGNAKFFGILIGTYPALVVKDPELIMRILVKDFKHFYDRGFQVPKHDLLGNNLFFIRNPKWKLLRYKTVPLFSSSKLKSYFEIMDKSTDDLIEYLNENNGQEESLPTKEVMGSAFTDIMSKVICGIEIHSMKKPNKKHVDMQNRVFGPSARAYLRNLINFFSPSLANKVNVFSSDIESYFNELTWGTIKLRNAENFKRKDLLQVMSETFDEEMKLPPEKRVLLKEDVVSNIFIMILAGYESSTSTSSLTLHELAHNQDVQDLARQEIREVNRQCGGKIKYEDIAKLKYLEQVISETLRFYPLVNLVFRQCMENYNIPGTDLVIEKGVHVHLPTLTLHTDPNFWKDPEAFDPDRFSEENLPSIVPGSYLPFGDGPRICIGKRFALLQLKLLLAKLLLHYQVSPCEKTQRHYPLCLNSQLAVPEGALWLKFTKLQA